MMGIPTHQYIEMAARLRRGDRRDRQVGRFVEKLSALESGQREIPLHNRIMAHCNSQWPKWKYIRARSDMASTIAVGAQDFTIFLPGGRVLCVECKSKTGKITPAQRDWEHEMAALGHIVHEVRSFDEFMKLIDAEKWNK
jgi:hypothetical protein